jgi:hypothetical protein
LKPGQHNYQVHFSGIENVGYRTLEPSSPLRNTQTMLAGFSRADVAFPRRLTVVAHASGKESISPDEPKSERHAPGSDMKSRKTKWSDEELKQLAEIVAAGGTPLRAAAKLNRNMTSCRIQARALGAPFTPLRVRRKSLLQKCAAAEKMPVR